MKDVIVPLLQQYGVQVGAGVACLVFARLVKKAWLMSLAKKFRGFGRALSKLGNTKLGKKSMDKLEEGPIATIIGFIGACIAEFSAGLSEDNLKVKVAKMVEPELMNVFERAISK